MRCPVLSEAFVKLVPIDGAVPIRTHLGIAPEEMVDEGIALTVPRDVLLPGVSRVGAMTAKFRLLHHQFARADWLVILWQRGIIDIFFPTKSSRPLIPSTDGSPTQFMTGV